MSEPIATEARLRATARYAAVSQGAEVVKETMSERSEPITMSNTDAMYVASNVLVALEQGGHVTLNIDPQERLRALVDGLEELDRQFPGKVRILMGAELSDRFLSAAGLHDDALAIERTAHPAMTVSATHGVTETPLAEQPCDLRGCCDAGHACDVHAPLHAPKEA